MEFLFTILISLGLYSKAMIVTELDTIYDDEIVMARYNENVN